MEIRWKNKGAKDIDLAYVTDNDTEILNFIGYHHVGKRTLLMTILKSSKYGNLATLSIYKSERSTKIKLSQKQKVFVKEIFTDEDGICCVLRQGFKHRIDHSKILHCESYSKLRNELKLIVRVF